MTDLIMQLSDVMRAEVKSLDTAAHNAANTATPGFRSERAVVDGAAFLKQVNATPSTPLRHITSMRDGPLNVSGVNTDFALRGNAWFAVETPDGIMLTRDGRFRLNDVGTLVNRGGHAVLAEDGALQGLKTDFKLAADGTVFSDNRAVAKLRIVHTPDAGQLTAKGDGLYQYDSELSSATGFAVVQGAYEVSNVDTASDMLQLMQTTRHIETLQRSMSAYDQMLSTGINQLGK